VTAAWLDVRGVDVERGPRVVIALEGTLTTTTAEKLRALLKHLEAQALTDVVVDLGHVEHVDAAGIGLLIAARFRCRRAGGTLAVRHPTSAVTAALRVAGALDLVGDPHPHPQPHRAPDRPLDTVPR
jgi:anti-sigma B factor antagonist